MRPKFVFAAALAALAAFAVAMVLEHHFKPVPSAPVVSAAPATAPEADLKPTPVPAPPPMPVAASAPVVTNVDTNAIALAKEQHAEFVKKRGDELMAMAMLDDTASHQPIIEDLTNSDRAIRKVALEAVQQTQDRALIPQMQQIADTTDDEDYKQALDDAIAYMKLPTLTEVMKAQKAQQNSGGNSTTPATPPAQDPGTTLPSAQGQP
jgi:hypothetical protein